MYQHDFVSDLKSFTNCRRETWRLLVSSHVGERWSIQFKMWKKRRQMFGHVKKGERDKERKEKDIYLDDTITSTMNLIFSLNFK